jgi:FdhD protein
MSGLVEVQVQRIVAGDSIMRHERVVEELPVALRYNDQPFAVMLATPADLDDFALGFSLSEGVVAEASELRSVDCSLQHDGVIIEMAIPQERFDLLQTRRRAVGGYSGCGLCGTETLREAMRPTPRVASTLQVDADQVFAALQALGARQPINAASGGVHAAAHVGADGMRVREDVGRHNALDKLIGSLARADAGPGFVLMSSRASYEIVHKAASAGIEFIVAISAPTALAIRTAEAAGLTLVAFARGRAMNVYAGAQRIRGCG